MLCKEKKIVKEFTNNVGIFRVEYIYSHTEETLQGITDVYRNVHAFMVIKFVTITRTILMPIEDNDL